MQNSITLDRNKIVTIGINPKSVTIKMLDKFTNELLDSWKVYKVTRAKQKLICYCIDAILKMKFVTKFYAKKTCSDIRKELKL